MARYYTENIGDSICEVVAQDDTGIYVGMLSEWKSLSIAQIDEPREVWIKLPEWDQPRKVSTTSREYLECKRRVERNQYVATKPSAIKERPGTAEEVIRAVFDEADSDRVLVNPNIFG